MQTPQAPLEGWKEREVVPEEAVTPSPAGH